MLAATLKDLDKLTFPKYASPKLDGIRCSIQDGVVLSRNFKPIPNKHVQKLFGCIENNGRDGELIVGSPTDPQVFRNTTSGVMSVEGEPEVTFWVFDRLPGEDELYPPGWSLRFSSIKFDGDPVRGVSQDIISNLQELEAFETLMLAEGYEGVMLRDPNALYKFGRSTEKEGGLLKVKRFSQDEAIITGFQERMHNDNEKTLTETGKMKRSLHAEGMVGRGDLGALEVKWGEKKFTVGSGFTDAERTEIWNNKEKYLGQMITFAHFSIGDYDLPRFPTFKGFRNDL